MGGEDGKRPDAALPLSIPPELKDVDTSWDDDPSERISRLPTPPFGSDPFDLLDRPTPIMDEPTLASAYARLARATAPTERPPPPPPPGPLAPADVDVADESVRPSPASTPVAKSNQGAAPPSSAESTSPLPSGGMLVRHGSAPVAPAPAEHAPPQSGPRPSQVEDLTLDLGDDFDHDSALQLADTQSSHPIADVPSRPVLAPPAPTPLETAPTTPPLHDPTGDRSVRMHDCYATGDFSGALLLAEEILALDPNDPQAAHTAERSSEVLTQMYTARLGSLDAVPYVAVAPDRLHWLSLDHRSGFLLSLVDGSARIEDILDMSGMRKLDCLRLLVALLEQKVISVR